MTKTLSERIKEIKDIMSHQQDFCKKYPNSEGAFGKFEGARRIYEKSLPLIEELQAELEGSQKMYQGALDFSIRKEVENQALLAKNGELEAKIERTINFGMLKLNQELEAKVKELEGKGWMPIETAPRDGSQILIFEKSMRQCDDEEIFIARWKNGRCCVSDDFIDYIGWHIGYNDEIDCWAENPTHWMPLPKPPTKTKGE